MSSFEATLEKEKKQLMRIDALKGKVDVYKQVQDGMGQMAKLIEHGSTLPLLLSFEVNHGKKMEIRFIVLGFMCYEA